MGRSVLWWCSGGAALALVAFGGAAPRRCAEWFCLRLNAGMSHAALNGAIRLPDGTLVRGRGLRRPRPGGAVPDRGLYLGSGRLRQRYEAELTWSHEWIDWPDFLVPRDRDRAVGLICELYDHARDGERVEVACGGGVGRTGTVMACLAVLAGVPAAETVSWVRAAYHPRAVETPWQRSWVRRFAAR